jgi:hypothetical protein
MCGRGVRGWPADTADPPIDECRHVGGGVAEPRRRVGPKEVCWAQSESFFFFLSFLFYFYFANIQTQILIHILNFHFPSAKINANVNINPTNFNIIIYSHSII